MAAHCTSGRACYRLARERSDGAVASSARGARRRTRRPPPGRRRRAGGARARCRRSRRRRSPRPARPAPGVEMPTPSSTGRSVTALQPPTHLLRVRGQLRCARRSRRAATRRRRSRATARRSPRSRSSGVVGAASSTVSTPCRVGGVAPAVELVEREVGQDRAVDTRRRADAPRAALVPERARRGCSTSSRSAGRGASMLGERVDHADRRRAEVERALARLLDRAAVHDRVGERDADLDRVGARVDDGAHDVAPLAAEPAGDVRDEQLAARRRAARAGALRDSRRSLIRARRAARRPARRPCRPGPTA